MRNTTIALKPPSALTATATGSAIDVSAFHGLCDVIMNSSATGGADHTSTVKLTHCDTSGGTYTDVTNGAFAAVTNAAASCQVLTLNADSLKKYVKVVSTLAGTNPTVTNGVVISAKKNYA